MINIKQKLKLSLSDYLSINIVFLLLIIVLRTIENLWLSSIHNFSIDYFKIFFSGLVFDLTLVLSTSAIFLILFLLIALIKRKAASVFYKLIVIIVLIIQFLLIRYFLSTLVLLDQSIFEFSFKEIFYIASKDGNSNVLLNIFCLLLFIVLFYFGIKKIKIKFPLLVGLIYLPLSFLPFIFPNILIADISKYESDIEYYLTNNNINYLAVEINKNLRDESLSPDNKTVKQAVEYYQLQNKDFEYFGKLYPFYRKQPLENPLGKYFRKSDTKPNLVFIIVESLSRSYSGPNANYKSFTPFLDSLTKNSLYWENFTSNADRSYGVIPNMLASLPIGKSRGIINMGNNIPYHESLIKLAGLNNYTTRFFYGGWSGFEQMDVFMENQNIDFILENKNFGGNYEKIKSDKFSWGYSDKELFCRSLEIINKASVKSKKPYLSVYFTLSIHHPFLCPNKEKYQKKFEQLISDYSFDEKTKKEYLKYSNIYSTILYDDDAFRSFFEEYKKRSEFENTIFVITGDHNIGYIPVKNNIDKYYVPLIIYSPLLKEAKRFKAVSSHLDITPSFAPLLKENYNWILPEKCYWLGKGLDTVSYFRNRNIYPFSNLNGKINAYISGKYFYNNSKLYIVSENMDLNFIENAEIEDSIKKSLEVYETINNYTCLENMILPLDYFVKNYNYQEIINFSTSFNSDLGYFRTHKKDIFKKVGVNGSKSVHIKPSQKYVLSISKKISGEAVNLEVKTVFFAHFEKYNRKKLPEFIISIEGDDDIIYHKIPFSEIIKKNEEWNRIYIYRKFKIPKRNKKKKVSIYILNSNKSEFFVDDYRIEVYSY